MLDIRRLYRDFGIDFEETGRGWVQCRCPMCQDSGKHLGFHPDSGTFSCWRCGAHSQGRMLSRLLGLDAIAVREMMRTYGGAAIPSKPKIERPKPGHKKFQHPTGTGRMTRRHREYLIGRGFDPERLERQWGLLGTGPVSILDGVSYRNSIIIPINWHGHEVSFQSRDVTGKHALRYMSCPAERELVHYKDILYGDQSQWGEAGICVEGVTDVWRLGPRAFATFGTGYTDAQVREIARAFRRVLVLFDDEPQAQEKAKTLGIRLVACGVRAFIDTVPGDPADLPQDIADSLVKKFL